ncbi:DUF3732 domain-containing protein [Alicyclobacillus sp. ALC3]|uniref:DUF3732 domain-containing protein n=1 Tax=Alicyclobacillus sp. ALC3 TaxID=2796143 RepID=UPI0019D46336|nr:DUF3732 domain-containing protein [Alicyclobacillus sp. ALC3]QSO53122.1 DUF3732 domain-containing protein [Alicyclobacillus curvatus]WDL96463.1 DUF3732 domain-containing protein [Alicyclobacillus sp. ALC3]
MTTFIRGIAVFNSQGDKRYIELKEGLNIITGDSKSGKSALLEIIDYCLGSSQATLPKGVITNFGFLYCIILQIRKTSVILGRHSFAHDGRTKMFLGVEPNVKSIREISLDDFDPNGFAQIRRILDQVGSLLGLTVTDMSEVSDERKEGKPSIRNMMSFLLQHQNLIANKFALFYRFDKAEKRQAVIRQLPVFAGWVDQKYYTMQYELDTKQKQLRRLERETQINERYMSEKQRELVNTFRKYYMLVGEKLDDQLPLEKLLELQDHLPGFNYSRYLTAETQNEWLSLKSDLEDLRREKQILEIKIHELKASQNHGSEYAQELRRLRKIAAVPEELEGVIVCPVCGKPHDELPVKTMRVQQSLSWLQEQLLQIDYHQNDFDEQIGKLTHQRDEVSRDIQRVTRRLDEIERVHKEVHEKSKTLQEQSLYAKAQIDLHVDVVRNNLRVFGQSDDLDTLRAEVATLKDLISGYDLAHYYREAIAAMSKDMNRIVAQLDFEDEFNPPNLVIDLQETFDLYQQDRSHHQKIYLSEMGSGANWLSCHLAVFLGFLHLFAREPESKVPNFLFLDQPSQVYFPNSDAVLDEGNEDSDFEKVRRIYTTILKEIDLVAAKTGVRPQVIVTDHVGDLRLRGYEFKHFVRADWHGSKFI